MTKFLITLLISLAATSASATQYDCVPVTLDEDESAVGPYTVVIQNDSGTIYVGDSGTPVDRVKRSGSEAIKRAISLCQDLSKN